MVTVDQHFMRVAPSVLIVDMRARARHTMEQFVNSLGTFLKLPIEERLSSEDAVVREMGFLDARLGKRRLAEFNVDVLPTEIERACLRARLDAEGFRDGFDSPQGRR